MDFRSKPWQSTTAICRAQNLHQSQRPRYQIEMILENKNRNNYIQKGGFQHNPLSVSELTKNIKELLEKQFPIIWIKGEISNYRLAASGHAYFSLKDEKAQISAVVFRGQIRQLRFDPGDGIKILGLGRISVYPPRGSYQIILEYMEPQGVGALQLAFEKLKQKLQDEGLFDKEHKIEIPFLIKKICVITSPTGAVIRDIINVALRRFPRLAIDVIGVNVQGRAAAAQITRAIELANELRQADVIIIARGGGSFEDLAPFNDENVARAIYSSRIPVVSAIGHEVDYTIADFVADLRAPTPSAAAELIIPMYRDIVMRIQELIYRQYAVLRKMIAQYRQELIKYNQRLIHPAKRISENYLRIDDLNRRLYLAKEFYLIKQYNELKWYYNKMIQSNPALIIEKQLGRLSELGNRIAFAVNNIISTKRNNYETLKATLDALNPAEILNRGYSIVLRKEDRKVITNSGQVEKNQLLEILLARGGLDVSVQRKTYKKSLKLNK